MEDVEGANIRSLQASYGEGGRKQTYTFASPKRQMDIQLHGKQSHPRFSNFRENHSHASASATESQGIPVDSVTYHFGCQALYNLVVKATKV